MLIFISMHVPVYTGEAGKLGGVIIISEGFLPLQNSKEKSPQNYIELKTSRIILTDRNKASFRR